MLWEIGRKKAKGGCARPRTMSTSQSGQNVYKNKRGDLDRGLKLKFSPFGILLIFFEAIYG